MVTGTLLCAHVHLHLCALSGLALLRCEHKVQTQWLCYYTFSLVHFISENSDIWLHIDNVVQYLRKCTYV